jgi:hypothetical protein
MQEERREMEEWDECRCRVFPILLEVLPKLPLEELEELEKRLRYIEEDLPESLQSKFHQ